MMHRLNFSFSRNYDMMSEKNLYFTCDIKNDD